MSTGTTIIGLAEGVVKLIREARHTNWAPKPHARPHQDSIFW